MKKLLFIGLTIFSLHAMHTDHELKEALMYADKRVQQLPQEITNPQLSSKIRYVVFVGPPASFKTTTAHAIAHTIQWEHTFVSASSFVKGYRNQSCQELQALFNAIVDLTQNGNKKILLTMDELNVLLDFATDKTYDSSANAIALQTFLDSMAHNKNFYFIGIGNSFENIPDPLKSRFLAHSIIFKQPDDKQRIMMIIKNEVLHNGCMLDTALTDQQMVMILDDFPCDPRMIAGIMYEACSTSLFHARIVTLSDIVNARDHMKENMDTFKLNKHIETKEEQAERHHKESMEQHQYNYVQDKLVTMYSNHLNTTPFLLSLNQMQRKQALAIVDTMNSRKSSDFVEIVEKKNNNDICTIQ